MGANLSSKIWPNTSQDVIGSGNAFNDRNLGLLWLGSLYGMAMIWCTVTLVDHWQGPQRGQKTSFALLLAAMLMSTVWPIVILYLLYKRA